MATTTKKTAVKKFEIEDDANFIRFGGRVYTLTDVGKCKLNDVIETTKTHFEQMANQHTEGISDELVALARTQEREQLEHLRVVQSSNVCVIQPADFRKPIVAFGNGQRGYCMLRTTLWRPRAMYFGRIGYAGLESTIRADFRENGNRNHWPAACYDARISRAKPENVFLDTPHHDGWHAMCLDILNRSSMYRIAIEEFIPAQILTTYFDGSSIKFIPQAASMAQCHTHCMSGYDLCTGNLSSVNFWGNLEYHKLLQDINWESFAAREFAYIADNGLDVEYWNMHTMVRQLKILSITREEATSWRTRRT